MLNCNVKENQLIKYLERVLSSKHYKTLFDKHSPLDKKDYVIGYYDKFHNIDTSVYTLNEQFEANVRVDFNKYYSKINGDIVDFFIMTRDYKNSNDNLSLIFEAYKNTTPLKKLVTENIKARLLETGKAVTDENIYKTLHNNAIENGFNFHGFSSANKESILENGFLTDNRNDEYIKFEKIFDIMEKYDVKLPSFSRNWAKSSTYKVFATNEAETAIAYSFKSPEWVCFLFDSYPFINKDLSAMYKERDNILGNFKKATMEEKVILVKFFNSLINKYVKQEQAPQVALLSNKLKNKNTQSDVFIERLATPNYDKLMEVYKSFENADIEKSVAGKMLYKKFDYAMSDNTHLITDKTLVPHPVTAIDFDVSPDKIEILDLPNYYENIKDKIVKLKEEFEGYEENSYSR